MSQKRPPLDETTAELRELVAEHNALDVELYRFARERFEAEMPLPGELDREVEELRARSAEVSQAAGDARAAKMDENKARKHAEAEEKQAQRRAEAAENRASRIEQRGGTKAERRETRAAKVGRRGAGVKKDASTDGQVSTAEQKEGEQVDG